jgi:hypothetical protein
MTTARGIDITGTVVSDRPARPSKDGLFWAPIRPERKPWRSQASRSISESFSRSCRCLPFGFGEVRVCEAQVADGMGNRQTCLEVSGHLLGSQGHRSMLRGY